MSQFSGWDGGDFPPYAGRRNGVGFTLKDIKAAVNAHAKKNNLHGRNWIRSKPPCAPESNSSQTAPKET